MFQKYENDIFRKVVIAIVITIYLYICAKDTFPLISEIRNLLYYAFTFLEKALYVISSLLNESRQLINLILEFLENEISL